MSNLLDAALTYARSGWHVFPIHTPRPDGACSCLNSNCRNVGKHPRTMRGFLDATTGEAQIRAWWEMWPDANVGIRAGACSGMFVVDTDPKNGGMETLGNLQLEHGPLPVTFATRTGSGGSHHFFRHPNDGRTVKTGANTLGAGIDTRGDGGYVVAPPSLHVSGERYEWRTPAEATDLAVAPAWILSRLVSTDRASGQPMTRAQEFEPSTPFSEGSRNATLCSFAGTMRRRGMSHAAIEAALLVENRDRCVPPLDEDEVCKIAASVARYAPDEDPTDRARAAVSSFVRDIVAAGKAGG